MLFRTIALLSLASLAVAAETKLLRTSDVTPHQEEDIPSETGFEDDVLIDDDFGDIESFAISRGGKCTGGVDRKAETSFLHCEGEMKNEFTGETTAQEINEEAASYLMDQLHSFMPQEPSQMVLSDETIEALFMSDDDEGSIELVGSANMEWTCKMSFAKNGTEMTQALECSAKGGATAGKKTGDGSALKKIDEDGN